MKERPIMFSGAMVRALLAGAKTQTRRTAKNVPAKGHNGGALREIVPSLLPNAGDLFDVRFELDNPKAIKCPYGAPGDRLWVRETFAANVPGCVNGISYRADHIDPKGDGPDAPMKWTPAIHMPRAASRLSLAVTGIRVERVQSISEADATAEGVMAVPHLTDPTASGRFCALWAEINGAASWATNPYVWVVGFNLVRAEPKG